MPVEEVAAIVEYLDALGGDTSALELADGMGVAVYAVPAERLAFDVAQVFRVRGRWVIHIDETLSETIAELAQLHELAHVALDWFGFAFDAGREELCCDLVAEELLARRLGRERASATRFKQAERVGLDQIVEHARPGDDASIGSARGAA